MLEQGDGNLRLRVDVSTPSSTSPQLTSAPRSRFSLPSRGTQRTQAGGQVPEQGEQFQGQLDQAGRRRLPHQALPGPIQGCEYDGGGERGRPPPRCESHTHAQKRVPVTRHFSPPPPATPNHSVAKQPVLIGSQKQLYQVVSTPVDIAIKRH